MRGVGGVVLLVIGMLVHTSSAAHAQAVTETDTFNMKGPVCTTSDDYAPLEAEFCIDGRYVFHSTVTQNGRYSLYSQFVGTESSRIGSSDCYQTADSKANQRWHRNGEVNQVAHVEHTMTIGEFTYRVNCDGVEREYHCSYDVFYHFANDRFQFDRSVYDCVGVPL
jgi:hypothetical protein